MPTAVAPFQLPTTPGDGTTNSTCLVSDWFNNSSVCHYAGQFGLFEQYYTESETFTAYISKAGLKQAHDACNCIISGNC